MIAASDRLMSAGTVTTTTWQEPKNSTSAMTPAMIRDAGRFHLSRASRRGVCNAYGERCRAGRGEGFTWPATPGGGAP
jgi:hypothetical protein